MKAPKAKATSGKVVALKSRTAVSARDLAVARRVFATEAKGLEALGQSLDAGFSDAVDLIDKCKGRVVVSGMGKSGHVAHKIAATLASTGSPAFFVHPAEASHGDLGMVTRADVVVAISNSGETAELADLIAHTKRFRIPLIAITSRSKSSLADNADVTLLLPATAEACPVGLAPTTSTTMTMALGDAIAVALMERRGFTADDFQRFHPGGQIGRNLLKVVDIMHRGDDVPLIDLDAPMSTALIEMTAKHFGCVGVLDDRDRLIGIVTDGDLRRHMSANLPSKIVRDVMTKAPVTIRSKALAAEALGVMNERAITALFVVDGREVVGIIHIHDCLRAGVA
jgi:arabinose-5-phosphate isomerase